MDKDVCDKNRFLHIRLLQDNYIYTNDIQLYQHEWKLEKREIVWKHDARKNVLYFFYNIAQRTLTEKWREIFRVDIELYQHGS